MGSKIIHAFVAGAVMFGFLVSGLFFFKFWKQTRDRFFAIFGISCWFLALERLALLISNMQETNHLVVYLIRLVGFVLIIIAILDKNVHK